jgi:sec-independent protein translocase protein TatB
MFDIGWDELLLIGIVALIVVGPKDLPRMMRVLGQWTTKARGMASQFRSAFDDMVRETELEELRKTASDVRALTTDPLGVISKPTLPAVAAGAASAAMTQNYPTPLAPDGSLDSSDVAQHSVGAAEAYLDPLSSFDPYAGLSNGPGRDPAAPADPSAAKA